MQILVGAGVNADVSAIAAETGADASSFRNLPGMGEKQQNCSFGAKMCRWGLPGLSEFSLWRCDENAVRAARKAFDACCGAGQEART